MKLSINIMNLRHFVSVNVMGAEPGFPVGSADLRCGSFFAKRMRK